MATKEERINQIVQLLQESFQSRDTKKIKEIQEKLSEFSKNFEEIVDILVHIISIPQGQISLDLKKSAAVYLKNVIQASLERLSSEQLLALLRPLLNFLLSSENCHKTLESTINTAIFQILSTETFVSRTDYTKQVISFFISAIKSAKTEDYIKVTSASLSTLTVLIQSKCVNKENIEDIIQTIIPIPDDIFSKVSYYISETEINKDFVLLLKNVFELFYSIYTKSKQAKATEAKCAFLFDKYGSFAFELINIMFLNEESSKQHRCVIYFSNDVQLNFAINSMKAKAFQFLTFITQISGEEIKNETLANLDFALVKVIADSVDFIIKEKMKYISAECSTDSETNDSKIINGFNTILYNMLAFLTRSLIREPIKKNFEAPLKDFLLNILFPLIVPPSEDVEKIQNDGEDYYQFLEDFVEEHKIKNYRTAACFLLKKLTTKYYDSYQFICSFALQLLEVSLSGADLSSLNQNELFLYLGAKETGKTITQFDVEKQIAFSLIIVSVFSENISDNKQFNATLKRIISSNIDKLNNINSVLIKTFLCKVYQLFIPGFFQKLTDENKLILQKVFQFLILQSVDSKYPGLGFQGTEALIEMTSSEEDYLPSISIVINQYFPQIIALLEETEVYNLFELVNKIILDITIDDKSVIDLFISKIVTRIKKDIISNSDEDNIEKTFAILISFLRGKNKYDDPLKMSQFEELISPLVAYIKTPKKITFVDEILLLVKEYIASAERPTNLVDQLIPYLIQVCEKFESFTEEVYNLLLTFIDSDYRKNGCQKIAQNLPEIVKAILPDYNDISSDKYELLLANKIFSLGIKDLPPQVISQLVGKAVECAWKEISNSDNDKGTEAVIQIGLATIGTGLIYYPHIVMESLSKTNSLNEYFMNCNTILHSGFYSCSLAKCIILGLCSVIENGGNFSNEQLVKLFRGLFNLIKKQKKESSDEAKKLMKKELNCNFVQEDEEDDEEEEEETTYKAILQKQFREKMLEMGEDSEDKELIEESEVNFTGIDEFEHFAKEINEISARNPEVRNGFLSSLSDMEKKMLEEIIHIRKVAVKYNDKTLAIPRRTVKIKRSTPQGSI